MMHADDVCEVLSHLERAGLSVWVDGGWGVDALLGVQTRPHDDLDLVMLAHEYPMSATVLPGFHPDLDAQPGMPYRYVLMDARRRVVDIHPVVIASTGEAVGTYVPREVLYPAGGLDGHGTIQGQAVRCLSASCQVLKHSGYANHGPDEYDYRDMSALARRFAVTLPTEYAHPPGWRHARRARLDTR